MSRFKHNQAPVLNDINCELYLYAATGTYFHIIKHLTKEHNCDPASIKLTHFTLMMCHTFGVSCMNVVH